MRDVPDPPLLIFGRVFPPEHSERAYGGLDLGMVDTSSPKGQVSTNSGPSVTLPPFWIRYKREEGDGKRSAKRPVTDEADSQGAGESQME